MTTVFAGFDRINATIIQTDTLATSGLGNCIAVAGINANANIPTRILAHYNTFWCFTPERSINVDELNEFKRWLSGKINATKFEVRLGTTWSNAIMGITPEAMAIVLGSVFETTVDPRSCQRTCFYTPQGVVTSDDPPEEWDVKNRNGDEIPYKNYF